MFFKLPPFFLLAVQFAFTKFEIEPLLLIFCIIVTQMYKQCIIAQEIYFFLFFFSSFCHISEQIGAPPVIPSVPAFPGRVCLKIILKQIIFHKIN